MTQQNKDKEIMGEVQYLYARQQSFTETWEVVENRVKQLIQQAREEERREVVEEIKNLQYEHSNTARHGEDADSAYDRIINTLTK